MPNEPERLLLGSGRVLHIFRDYERECDSDSKAEWCEEHAGSRQWARSYFGDAATFDIDNDQIIVGFRWDGCPRASLSTNAPGESQHHTAYAFIDLGVATEYRLRWA